MSEPFEPDLTLFLPKPTLRILQIMGEQGVVGESPEEVAGYLILRSLDDLMRAGVLRLEQSEAKEP